jgi:hypothetical protein
LLTRGLRKLLLLDKPVNGCTSSKAALQSEAGQASKREGLTQGKLDSTMSGSARKSMIAEKHWPYSRRQQASCESKLRTPVQCWQHLHKNFLPEVRKASPLLQKMALIRSRTLLKLLSKHIIEKMAV